MKKHPLFYPFLLCYSKNVLHLVNKTVNRAFQSFLPVTNRNIYQKWVLKTNNLTLLGVTPERYTSVTLTCYTWLFKHSVNQLVKISMLHFVTPVTTVTNYKSISYNNRNAF